MSSSSSSSSSSSPDTVYQAAFDSYFESLKQQTAIDKFEVSNLTSRADSSDWVSVRIFCSSTFKDQLEERHILKTVVIPDLEVWCRERGIEVVMIDLLWGIPMNSTAAFTIRTCLGELDVCRHINSAPYFLYLGGQRFGWPPTRADINDDALYDQYAWMEGASVTSMEVLHGSLRTANPNAIYCLRDESFIEQKVPVHERIDFMENDPIAAAKQAALLKAIVNSNSGHVIKYNPATDISPNNNTKATLTSSSRGSWDYFAEQVSKQLKLLLSRQYPRVSTGLSGSLTSMRRQHSLYADTLIQHTVERRGLLERIWNSIQQASHPESGTGKRLIVIGAESGRGKSSLMAQLSAMLRTRTSAGDGHDPFHIITHFVGPAERSDEMGTLARRIIGELQIAWDEDVDESKLPDDDQIACAQAKQLIMRGPPNINSNKETTETTEHVVTSVENNNKKVVVLFVDAVNMLGGDGTDGEHSAASEPNKLDWLPNQEDCAQICRGLVIVVSSTPGPELDQLITRAGVDASIADLAVTGGDASALGGIDLTKSFTETLSPYIHVGPLNDEDKHSIAQSLLTRYTKQFSTDQMALFLKNPGASNPLWQTVSMFRLRQTAVFETVTKMILAMPTTMEELLLSELESAEKEVGKSFVKGLLLASVVSRNGLRESEAILLLPVLAKAMDLLDQEQGLPQGLAHGQLTEIDYDTAFSYHDNNKSVGNQQSNPTISTTSSATATLAVDPYTVTNFLWARLRSVLDVFLQHTMCGAPVVLTPCHAIIRAAIFTRYQCQHTDHNHRNHNTKSHGKGVNINTSGNEASCVYVTRRILASLFTSNHPSLDTGRCVVEASWALIGLHNGPALTTFLSSERIMSYMWYEAGDIGRWELVKLWKVAEEMQTKSIRGLVKSFRGLVSSMQSNSYDCFTSGCSNEGEVALTTNDALDDDAGRVDDIGGSDGSDGNDKPLPPMLGTASSSSADKLGSWGLHLVTSLVTHQQPAVDYSDKLSNTFDTLNVPVFRVLRALFELLKMMRREGHAYEFLMAMQASLESVAAQVVSAASATTNTTTAATAIPIAAAIMDKGSSITHMKIAVAWVHASLGDCLYSRGDYNKAVELWKQAIVEFEAIPGVTPNLFTCELRLCLGRYYDETKKYEEAIEVFDMTAREVSMIAEIQQAKVVATTVCRDDGGDVLTNTLDPSSVISASSLSVPTVSSSSIQSSVETDHLSMYKELLSDEKNEENHHHDMIHIQIYSADIEKEVANVLFSLKRYDEALERYQHAYTILKRALGEHHPKASRAIWGIGITQKEQGKLQESLLTHQKVYRRFYAALGKNHPDTADMLYNIGLLYKDLSDYDAAEEHLKMALTVYIKVYGARHRHVGWTWQDIGGVVEKAGELQPQRLSDAKAAYEMAYSIRLECLGEDDEETVESKQSLEKLKESVGSTNWYLMVRS